MTQPAMGGSGLLHCFSFIDGFGEYDLQRIHGFALSRPAANFLRLALLCLLLNPCEAFGRHEVYHEVTARVAQFENHEVFGFSQVFESQLHDGFCNNMPVKAASCHLAQRLFSLSQGTCIGFFSWIFLWVFFCWIYHTRLLRLCLVLSCLMGPQGCGFRRVGFGCVVASAMEPVSTVERERAAHRGGNLAATRVARKATIDAREKLLNDFRSWHGMQLSILLTSKPPDPEEICRWLVCYGQEMYRAGKAYGKYAETINVRPAVRKMLAPAWDLAFAWLADEPYQHHQAMPISIYSMCYIWVFFETFLEVQFASW